MNTNLTVLNQSTNPEFIKCSTDIEYFISKYIHIQINGMIQNIPKLTDIQSKILKYYSNHNYTIYESDMNMVDGKTTIALAICLHQSLFNNHSTVGLFAPSRQSTLRMSTILRAMCELLPASFKQDFQIVNNHVNYMRFSNGSTIKYEQIDYKNLMGVKYDLMYFDEPQSDKKFDKKFTTMLFNLMETNPFCKILMANGPNDGLTYWDKFVKECCIGRNKFQYIW